MSECYLFEDSDIRAWAYDPRSFKSMGLDFDLVVATLDRSDLILMCAADETCPKQEFFVHCSFLIVGDAVRSSNFDQVKKDLLIFIHRAEQTGARYLLEFARRARHLIENPTDFDYDNWCGGEITRQLFHD